MAGSTRKILKKRNNLRKAADENGQTPLHYAAHFGYHKIVKLLLECDKCAAYITDKEKMTPLLMAARQGHYLTMREIINHCPGKKYNCRRFAHQKDIHGNTPLQVLAASLPYFFFIRRFCDGDVVTVRKENLDSQKKDQIFQLLNEVGRGEVAGGAVRPLYKYTEDASDFDKAREARSVVAALIATVTFAAAFTLPGGYKSDPSSDNQGTAILSHNSAFKAFVIVDAIAMVSSLLAITFNYQSALLIVKARKRSLAVYSHNLMMMFSDLGEASLVVAFVTGLYAVLKSSFALAVTTCTVILGFYIGFRFFFALLLLMAGGL
ncbi:protein of unknown function DUF3447 - like 10 [Theobroma cacao]|nr:protein of unknown function DUF3447 - like 10 [Theobroma cacao]WRX21561.1 protein of unknown function DUF3447 - like 10 [Theobroma cacao]